MNNKEQKEFIHRILAGVFFIAGLFLTVLVILALGKDKGLTQAKSQIAVLYHDVGGLMEGAPVRLAGVNVGRVSSINFLDKAVEGRKVRVLISVYVKFIKHLNQNAVYAIKTEGVLGEKLIEISVLEGGKKLDFSKPILGQDSLEIQDLAEVFARAAESFTKTSEDFNKIQFEELSSIMGETAHSLNTTANGLNALLKDLRYMTIKSRRLVDRLEQKVIEDNLFKVF